MVIKRIQYCELRQFLHGGALSIWWIVLKQNASNSGVYFIIIFKELNWEEKSSFKRKYFYFLFSKWGYVIDSYKSRFQENLCGLSWYWKYFWYRFIKKRYLSLEYHYVIYSYCAMIFTEPLMFFLLFFFLWNKMRLRLMSKELLFIKLLSDTRVPGWRRKVHIPLGIGKWLITLSLKLRLKPVQSDWPPGVAAGT